MSQAFIYSPLLLDATTVEQLFGIAFGAEKGTQRYASEMRTITHWRDYLQDLEGMCTAQAVELLPCLILHAGWGPEPGSL